MRSADRRAVLCLESLDSAQQTLLEKIGFRIVPVTIGSLDSNAPAARAILLRFQELTRFVQEFEAVRDVAINHGLLVLVLIETDHPIKQQHAWKAIDLRSLQTHPAKSVDVRYPSPPEIAILINQWNPGPGYNGGLAIEATVAISNDHRFLLRRAFSKFSKIRVGRLTGGASGAAVYRVKAFPTPSEEHPIPFLAKVDKVGDADVERVNFREYVRDNIPFNLRPNVIIPLSCYTKDSGIIVEDFVERATRLDEVLPASAPAQLIASLFQGTLRGWRLQGTKKTFNAPDRFRKRDSAGEERGLVRDNEYFREACARASKYFKRSYDPDKILTQVDGLKPVETPHCTVHCDLHARNVFVAAGSTDCLIIDYANIEVGAPACLDPACLEIDLVLGHARPSHFLRSAYSWPISPLAPSVRQQCETWLWEAVRAIRVEAELHTQPTAYAIALVGYLLRLARLKSVSVWRRAVAVCIAEWLLCQLHNEQTA